MDRSQCDRFRGRVLGGHGSTMSTPIRLATNRSVRPDPPCNISWILRLTCVIGSIPEHIREHVDLIKPTVHFLHRAPDDPAVLRKRSNVHLGDPSSFNRPKTNGASVTWPMSLAICDKYIIPDSLRVLYSIDYKPKVPNENSFGIGGSSSVRLSHHS